ncbi:hypothetical protein ACFRAE_10650 [Sphingobacterium sp. HJSM2_6]|uniref:hypothetical protein n=1 Tax=Sphingobacterium sp. HJSM2_6 TaxID=3366264 RepID=UPI003BBE8EC2
MKNFKLIYYMSCLFILSSCIRFSYSDGETSNSIISTIEYDVVKNYYVKNTVSDEYNGIHKIKDQTHFESLFAAAASMGEGGKPTEIDFDKHFVLAIIQPETNKEEKDLKININYQKDKVIIKLELIEGKELSHTYRPNTILILNKKYQYHNIEYHENKNSS